MQVVEHLPRRAAALAHGLLAGDPGRLAHTAGVAARAWEMAVTVRPRERPLLVAAAWLHDVGYADRVGVTGFHPLDAGVFLQCAGWPPRLCALVAHHSAAHLVAADLGLAGELAWFPKEESALADALTFADQTIGPDGSAVTVGQRLAEMLDRHGPDSPNARVHALRGPCLLAVADRVQRRLNRIGTVAV